MRPTVKFFAFLAGLVFFLGLGRPALAAVPQLSLSQQGGYGNGVYLVTVNNANPNSSFAIYERPSGTSLWSRVTSPYFYTNSSGYFSGNVDLGTTSADVYVLIGGVQSNTVNTSGNGGCGPSGCVGGLSFNPSSLNLASGQSATVYVTSGVNLSYYSLYITSNSNPNVASAYVSGNQVYVTGNNTGSTNIYVCVTGSNTCGTIYVTVNSNGGAGNINFSPASVSLAAGQSQQVSIYSNNGYGYNYYISNNSSPSVVSASINGSTINLYGQNSGNTTLTICQNGYSNSCGYLYVTVGGGNNNGQIGFSQSNVSLNAGQNQLVTIYNNLSLNNPSYYLYANSNQNVASANVSGNTVNVYGLSNGSTTLTICVNGYGYCGNIYVTVSGSGYGSITFSPSSVNISSGQSQQVSIYNNGTYNSGYTYYVSGNTNSNVASANISGNVLTVYGQNSGTSTLTVCQNGQGSCGYLYVNVTGTCYNGICNGGLSLSQTNVSLSSGQSTTVYAYNNNNSSLYVSSNTNSSVASAYVNGSNVNIQGLNTGSSTITICSSNYSSQCGYVYITVNGNSGSGSVTFSQSNVNVGVGQSQQVSIYSNNGYVYNYYISNNSSPSVVSASINGSTINLYGQNSGSTTLTVCQNNNSSQCGYLYVTVGNVKGVSAYPSGELINENGTVYIVYRSTKTGFASAGVFTGLGFSFSNVLNVSNSGLQGSGYIVNTSNAQHPWGTWIKNGTTVYFVHESGLIPVPNWDTFLQNGGQGAWIVNANSWDMRLPILPIMTLNDSRVM